MSERDLTEVGQADGVDLSEPIPGELSPPPTSGNGSGGVEDVLPGEAAVARAARRSLDGHSRGLRRIWPFLGPAFIAAVAYIDPGNFATNIAGGAKFGYLLLWVVLGANLIAMVVQTQSAKLGIATGKNLAEACRDSFSRRTSIGLWIQAEIVAAACDVAEVVGAALGLNLLFGIPLFPAGSARRRGRVRDPRPPAEGLSPPGGGHRGDGRGRAFWPSPSRSSSPIRMAARSPDTSSRRGSRARRASCSPPGIIGATVMPHVIYLHSALTQRRDRRAETTARSARSCASSASTW